MNLFAAFALLLNFAAAQTFEQLGPFGTKDRKLMNPNHWMAVVGDSGVTGVVTATDIEATVPSLMHLFGDFFSTRRWTPRVALASELPAASRFGIEKIEPLTRIFYSSGEFERNGWLGKLTANLTAKLALRLDQPEKSFAYMLGRSRGIAASDIVLVGQDGARLDSIADQLQRVFEMKTKTLPPLIVLSFTANDYCDEDIFDEDLSVVEARLSTLLLKAWSDAKESLQRPHPNGTRIMVLAPLDVGHVITNPDIQAKRIRMEGHGEVTCGQVREGELGFNLKTRFIQKLIGGLCPSVTGTKPSEIEKVERLRAVQQILIRVWQAEIDRLNRTYTQIRWELVDEVRQISFVADDVGPDCFHPSVHGHGKIAELLLKKI